jgi:2-oxoglutarate dehydrogenase E1 component
LAHIAAQEGAFSVVNSLLSEAAVMAFEYGFSKTEPKALVIWEAQFGDFANGAQVVIDQFISSGEQKWGMLCGLTIFLPHGFEGQGAEHSSGRMERYLQLCARHNMQICVPTTPAQMFHMLRRQMLRPMRKPLIVFTPKSLLRHKMAVSRLEELENGSFNAILTEVDEIAVEQVKKIILCSGKIYYELLDRRRSGKNDDTVILRIEQLYPFPDLELKSILNQYKNAQDILWCQEEPENQGAWYSNQRRIMACLSNSQTLRYVGRKTSAAPAVGYLHLHQEQQNTILREAFT